MAGRRSGRRSWRPRPKSHSTSGQRHSCSGAEDQPLRAHRLYGTHFDGDSCRDIALSRLQGIGIEAPARLAYGAPSAPAECAFKRMFLSVFGRRGRASQGMEGHVDAGIRIDRTFMQQFFILNEKSCSCPSWGQGQGVQAHGWRCETRRGRRLPAARAATPQARSCMPALPDGALRLSRLRCLGFINCSCLPPRQAIGTPLCVAPCVFFFLADNKTGCDMRAGACSMPGASTGSPGKIRCILASCHQQ